MKVLTIAIKHKVIELFLSGLAYDGIAQQLGIGKGSVVNIIDEFREGYIQAPPGMAGYIDELRKLVVDVKKHDTSVAQLKGYAKLHAKMKTMGVDTEQVNEWLDICQEIAAPDASNKEFVSAALELAAVKEKTGQGYLATIEDFKKKQEELAALKDEIAKGEMEFTQAKQEWVEDKNQAVKELQSITEAAKTAKETFKEQKKQFKMALDEYILQNKLTWHKVKIATALLDTTLNNADLSPEQIKEVTGLIAEAASIHSLVQQLDKTKKEVGPEVASLLRHQKRLEHDNFYLEHINQQCLNAHIQMAQQDEELTSRIEKKKGELNKLEQLVSAHVSEVLIASWVIGFLAKPENLYDSGFEEFIGKLLSIRKHLDGIEPKFAVQDGQTYCLFPAPQGLVDISKYKVDPGEARKMLAHLLVPLVDDKFIPRFQYEMGKVTEAVFEIKKELRSLK